MEFTRESIFVSSVRSFFRAFAALFGFLLAILLIFILILLFWIPGVNTGKGKELVVLPDAEGKKELLSENAPVILQLSINGIIGMDSLTGPVIEQILLDSREGFFRGDRVKGIFLYVNTPGGTVPDSDQIYRCLMEYKKKYNVPVHAYTDGINASGGMYVCSAADRISATPMSIVGSIGVLMGPFFNFSETMAKWGIGSLTITEGKDKDMLNSFRPWRPDEASSLVSIGEASYQRFTTIFTTGRKNIDKAKLVNEYGANVFIAHKAMEIGYIDDADSDRNKALAELVKAAGIEDGTKYQVAELKVPQSIFVELTKGKSPLVNGKLVHTFQGQPPEELSGKLLYLYR